MHSFENPSAGSHEPKPERESALTQNEIQLALMQHWAAREGKEFSVRNDLVNAWIMSGNASKFREYIEDGHQLGEFEDDMGALLEAIRGEDETLH